MMTPEDEVTLPGVPSSSSPPTEPDAALKAAVRQAVGEALAPVGKFLDERSQLMLDVVADAAEARAQVKAAVRTIRFTVWVKVAIIFMASFSVWYVLDQERADRRRDAMIGEQRRDTAVETINTHTDRVCRAH